MSANLYPSTDLCIAAFLIDESFPERWIHREGFGYSRKFLILMWLMMASFILLASYRGTLLSTLVPIYYERPINTFEEVERAGLPIFITKNNAPHWLMATDPRPALKKIFKKITLYPFPGGKFPDWVTQR